MIHARSGRTACWFLTARKFVLHSHKHETFRKPFLYFAAFAFTGCAIKLPRNNDSYLVSNSEAKYWASSLDEFLARLDTIRRIHAVLKNVPWSSDAERKLKSLGVSFNVEVFCQVLRSRDILPTTCVELFRWLKNDQSFKHTFHTYDTLIGILRESGQADDMRAVIEDYRCSSLRCDLTYFHNLIRWHAKAGHIDLVLVMWDQMRAENVKPGLGLCNIMIDLLGSKRHYRELLQVYHQTVHNGLALSSCTFTILIKHLASSGHLEAGVKIFEKLPLLKVRQTALMIAILIAHSASVRNQELVANLGQYVRRIHAKPTRQVLAFMHALESSGKLLESNIVAQCFWPELISEQNHVSVGYAYEDAGELYDGEKEEYEDIYYVNEVQVGKDHDLCINIPGLAYALKRWEPNTESLLQAAKLRWTSKLILRVLCCINKVNVAWKFLTWVQDQPGFRYTAPIMSRMIALLAVDHNMPAVEQLLKKAKKEGIPLSVHVMTAVIKAYGMLKNVDKVLETFHQLKDFGTEPNMEMYENVIHALVKQQLRHKAVEYFDEMKVSGLCPSCKAYVLMIECFGSAGDLGNACSLFRELTDLQREPNAEAYTAMIKAYFWNKQPELALKALRDCKKAGLEPTAECMDVTLKGLCALKRSKEAKALRLAMETPKKSSSRFFEALIQIDDILEESFIGFYLTCKRR